jgi:integrase
MRLTATTIRSLALPDCARDKTFFDTELAGFGLRLRDTGARSWLVQYAVGGRTRRMTLGSPETVDPGKAREAAKDILAKVRLGQDPAHDKQASRQDAAHTVGSLIPRFLQRQRPRLRPKSFAESTRHLTKDLRTFHALPIARLDRRAIAARLSEIAESRPATANRVRATASAFCSWAAREGLIENNPVAFTNAATHNGPRNRLLTDAELAAIWAALGEDHYSNILRLLIHTGARREEIGALRWPEIDLANALITLPPGRTKNNRLHAIPLSTAALAILTAQARSDSEFVFGASGRAGFQNWTLCKRQLDARIAASGAEVAPWVLHDFRRLISTTMHERLGVPPHIVEAILGHAGGHKSGVAGVYNKALYLDERRRALQHWSGHVMSIVAGVPTPANLIALRT